MVSVVLWINSSTSQNTSRSKIKVKVSICYCCYFKPDNVSVPIQTLCYNLFATCLHVSEYSGECFAEVAHRVVRVLGVTSSGLFHVLRRCDWLSGVSNTGCCCCWWWCCWCWCRRRRSCCCFTARNQRALRIQHIQGRNQKFILGRGFFPYISFLSLFLLVFPFSLFTRRKVAHQIQLRDLGERCYVPPMKENDICSQQALNPDRKSI